MASSQRGGGGRRAGHGLVIIGVIMTECRGVPYWLFATFCLRGRVGFSLISARVCWLRSQRLIDLEFAGPGEHEARGVVRPCRTCVIGAEAAAEETVIWGIRW